MSELLGHRRHDTQDHSGLQVPRAGLDSHRSSLPPHESSREKAGRQARLNSLRPSPTLPAEDVLYLPPPAESSIAHKLNLSPDRPRPLSQWSRRGRTSLPSSSYQIRRASPAIPSPKIH